MFHVAQLVKNLPAMQGTCVRSLGWEDPLEKGKATHSSILAWRIPWTVESMGLQRVRDDWVTFTFVFNAALVTIIKILKQPKCLLIDEWRCSIYTQWNSHSHRKNEILPSVTIWMQLEGIMLSDISQTKKYCIHLYVESKTENKWTNKPKSRYREKKCTFSLLDTEKKTVVATGKGAWGLCEVSERD